ncbi:MAG: O-antigen ligase family protein [Acidobacteriota bacterium]
MKEKSRRGNAKKISYDNPLHKAIFWTVMALLFLIPLAFSTAIQAIYALPKFVLLIVGAAAILLCLALPQTSTAHPIHSYLPLLKSRQMKLLALYFLVMMVSSTLGVAPLVAWFGTSSNFLGVLTQLGFLVVAVGVMIAINESEKRLLVCLWTMMSSGSLVALYATLQFFGLEPFVPTSVYTFASAMGEVTRVCATLGHSNYLGNFLLYTLPLAVAFGIATNGKARWLALAGAMLSLVAIIASGTRGAWVGLLMGTAIFLFLEFQEIIQTKIFVDRKLLLRTLAGVSASLIVVAVVVVFSPAARSVAERVQALRQEGFSSSGRLLLWRDSIKMIPAHALIGCGSEGFRKAFLAYKSKELAQLSPKQNNENPHNAYIENAVAYGIAGFILYLTLIISTLIYFARARRQSNSPRWRTITTGLLAAFASVLTHNIFIFNQISTGLYFFTFIALAVVIENFTRRPARDRQAAAPAHQAEPVKDKNPPVEKMNAFGVRGLAAYTMTGVASLLFIAALWYSAGLIDAEVAFKGLFAPAVSGNFQTLTKQGERVTSSPMPTGAYDFLYARTLDSYARQLASAQPTGGNLEAVRKEALNQAILHTEKSLRHTNTPDLNYSLLALLALTAGDPDRLYSAASEAVKWDPNNFQTRWLMAEAYLARGEKAQAQQEAEIALELYHTSPEVASVLARARGESDPQAASFKIMADLRMLNPKAKRSADELIDIARALSQKGKLRKARLKLLTAIARAGGNCADCHRELAVVYEKMANLSEAIAEWQLFIGQSPEPGAIEQAKARIEILKQKKATPQ